MFLDTSSGGGGRWIPSKRPQYSAWEIFKEALIVVCECIPGLMIVMFPVFAAGGAIGFLFSDTFAIWCLVLMTVDGLGIVCVFLIVDWVVGA